MAQPLSRRMVVRPTDKGLCFTTRQIVLPEFPLNTVISLPRNNQVKHFFGKKFQVQNHPSSFSCTLLFTARWWQGVVMDIDD